MKVETIMGLLIVAAIAFLGGLTYSLSYSSVDTIENVTIESKERVQNGESSKYMIFTDKEVFENTDSLMHLKWNSSDVYRDLKPGAVCDLTVNWFRVPFLSMYRNILEYSC